MVLSIWAISFACLDIGHWMFLMASQKKEEEEEENVAGHLGNKLCLFRHARNLIIHKQGGSGNLGEYVHESSTP